MNNLENIKQVLTNFEMEYDHREWLRLEKDLPKPSGLSSFSKILLVSTAVIITVVGTYFILNHKNDTINNNVEKTSQLDKTIKNNTKIENTQKTIEVNTINNSTQKNVIPEVSLQNSTSELTNSQEQIASTNNQVENSSNIEKSIIETPNTIKPENTQIANNIDVTSIKFNIEVLDNCTPAKVVFTATNVPEGYQITWNTDDSYRIIGNTAEHIYYESGNYMPEASIVYNNFILKTEKLKEISINKTSLVKINFDSSENVYYFSSIIEEEASYLWNIDNQQFSDKDVRFEFNKSGTYKINLSIVNEFGCKNSVSEQINISIEHIYYLPNAFIPTSNGVNSFFGPIGENMNFSNYQLIIVDGNGNKVFVSDNVDFKWNGKINNIGEEAKPGNYLWEIKTIDEFGNLQIKKGRVNLIRN